MKNLKVRDLITMLSLLDQDSLVCQYYNGIFTPMKEDAVCVITTENVALTEDSEEMSIVCINSQDIESDGEMNELAMEESLDSDVKQLCRAINALSEGVNLLSPEMEGHRLENVHALAAFNKVKAASIEMLSNSAKLMEGLVEIMMQDMGKFKNCESKVMSFPASDNAGGGAD